MAIDPQIANPAALGYVQNALINRQNQQQQGFQNNLAMREQGFREQEFRAKQAEAEQVRNANVSKEDATKALAGSRLLQREAQRGADPMQLIPVVAPNLQAGFEQQNGPGSFSRLSKEQILQIAKQVELKAMYQLGMSPEAEPVKWEERQGPRGSIISYNPQTREPKQIVGPDNTQPQTGMTAYQQAQIDAQNRRIDMMGQGTQRAPAYRDIIDPKDPSRLITVDGNLYRPGGSVGDTGVIGIAGKEPSAAKAGETRGTGKQAVSDQIMSLRDIYNQLNEGGGIVNTDNSFNVGNAAQSSELGQMVGRAFGTKNQSYRNQISQQRPLLLQAIRQATGMSAKQMDSNVELKLYLAAATDPALDYQANMSALDNLERLYGIGDQAVPQQPAQGQPRVINFEDLP